MSWLNKLLPSRIRKLDGDRRSVPEGRWTKCEHCAAVLYQPDLERNIYVCPKCSHHMRISARARLLAFLDDNEAPEEIGADLAPMDVLKFKDRKRYRERLQQAQHATGEKDALIALAGRLHGIPVVACSFEFDFMGGSMGGVVGEKFVRSARQAEQRGTPLICFCASGGARMQEGLSSLMQMVKTTASIVHLKDRGLPYFVVLQHPTMGGVSASLASLGDVIIAEPGALVGFAGPRVIKQTVRESLPEGFQRSESLLEHGGIDMIVDRRQMRERLASLVALLLKLPNPVADTALSAAVHE